MVSMLTGLWARDGLLITVIPIVKEYMAQNEQPKRHLLIEEPLRPFKLGARQMQLGQSEHARG